MSSYRLQQNLGQIDHNLYHHPFDDVICKPPIQVISFEILTNIFVSVSDVRGLVFISLC